MNWHDVIDERALEMDRVLAQQLRKDPAKLRLAVEWIQRFLDSPGYSRRNKDARREWMEIVRVGLARVLEALEVGLRGEMRRMVDDCCNRTSRRFSTRCSALTLRRCGRLQFAFQCRPQSSFHGFLLSNYRLLRIKPALQRRGSR